MDIGEKSSQCLIQSVVLLLCLLCLAAHSGTITRKKLFIYYMVTRAQSPGDVKCSFTLDHLSV